MGWVLDNHSTMHEEVGGNSWCEMQYDLLDGMRCAWCGGMGMRMGFYPSPISKFDNIMMGESQLIPQPVCVCLVSFLRSFLLSFFVSYKISKFFVLS